jgi:pimeloyl-ACP methyl ester carboxylesterase
MGKPLSPYTHSHTERLSRYRADAENCNACPLKPECTPGDRGRVLMRSFDVPTLIVHGDDDQIVPIVASALCSSKLVKNSVLKIYEGGPHGLADTHKEELNADLLTFLRG